MSIIANITNIHLLKILQRFTCIKTFKCHSKVTTSELSRFLDIIKPTLIEFHTQESHIDFSKLFRATKLPNLRKFVFTNSKKSIQDVDIRSLVEGCPNLTYLDLSNIPSIDNRLICKAVEKLPKLETFILLKNVKANYEIFGALSSHCP